MKKMEITNAQYYRHYDGREYYGENIGITATIDGVEWSVPLAPGNGYYDEIMRQVESGELTIQDAE